MITIKLKEREISIKTLLESSKIVKHESDDNTNFNWCGQYSYQRIGAGIRGNHRNDNIVKIGQNTEKSPETWGDLLSLKLQ